MADLTSNSRNIAHLELSNIEQNTPARTYFISGLKSRVLKFTFLKHEYAKNFFIMKFTKPLQSYCYRVQKNLPRKAELG